VDRRSLAEHLTGQWTSLSELTGVDPDSSGGVLSDLLGDTAQTPLAAGPPGRSDISDDHTPIEFSVAYHPGGTVLRLLAEAQPGGIEGARAFLDRQAGRPGLVLHRLDEVWDLFAAPTAPGSFGMWHSVVFRAAAPPEFKVYLDPAMHGPDRAVDLITEALGRLGLNGTWPSIARTMRGGEDHPVFFALDLHDGPRTRIKVYLAHQAARAGDMERAAAVVHGIDPAEAATFCTAAGGDPGTFDGRPLISSYTLTPGADRPVGYSVYVPIRGYVSDDEQARERVVTLLDRQGLDGTRLDPAIAAVARRPLRDGVGLIAHVSLRLGRPSPGVTVYLAAEAYHTDPPRPRPSGVLRPTRPEASPASAGPGRAGCS